MKMVTAQYVVQTAYLCTSARGLKTNIFLGEISNASSEARRKFADKNNAVFIDLFAGPGKCIIKNEKEKLIAEGFELLKEMRRSLMSISYFSIFPMSI